MRRLLAVGALSATVALSGCRDINTPDAAPLELVLMIGDGMGEGALEAARLTMGGLRFDALPRHASVRTASASHDVTDSGAAATALSTGRSTYNGAIGVGPDSLPLETVLEQAMQAGMAVGVVSTSSVTHATPASFLAHVPSRVQEEEIARQIAGSGADVVLGGGESFFAAGSRTDGLALLDTLRLAGCRVVTASDPFGDAVPERCVVGLFAEVGMARADTRQPSLTSMAEFAIRHLRSSSRGFVLMVEGSQIDWAGHANDSAWLVDESVDFHTAVAAVHDLLGERSNSLLVVTADHETGGLQVTPDPGTGGFSMSWTTQSHTAADVPLRASAGACFDGSLSNDQVGRLLKDIVAAASLDPCGEAHP